MCKAGLHQKRVLCFEEISSGSVSTVGAACHSRAAPALRVCPTRHAQALQLGQKRWPVVPPGIPVSLQMGTPRLCESVDGEHVAGTAAEVGAATNTQAPWKGHGVAPRCSQQ